MDEIYRQAVRYALSSGEELELMKVLLHQMTPEARSSVIRYAGFLAKRDVVTWEYVAEDERHKIPIVHLTDDAIKRIVRSSGCQRVFRDLQSENKWEREYARNSKYYTMLQEAEYRGIKIEGDRDKLQRSMFQPCIERRHDFQRLDNALVCINCRQKVTDEEVNDRLPSSLRLL